MGIEIERKFLVDADQWSLVKPNKGTLIIQGYLSKSVDLTTRVRIKGSQGYITIKGATENISRLEFEYEIPVNEAKEMLDKLCLKKIEKTRYEIEVKGFIWEVDEFHTPKEGLILAEIELSNEDEIFFRPKWVLKEVSGQPQYYNSNML